MAARLVLIVLPVIMTIFAVAVIVWAVRRNRAIWFDENRYPGLVALNGEAVMTVALRVDAQDPTPPCEQLHRQLASAITFGALAPGTRLPSVRQLQRIWAWRPGPSCGPTPNSNQRAL